MTCSLHQLDFTDILMSDNGRVFIRNIPDQPPMIDPPGEVTRDIKKLQNLVLGGEEKGLYDWSVCFEGVSYRVARVDGRDGLWYALRRAMPVGPLEALGIHPALMTRMIRACDQHGLMLFCGRTGAGKTTSACTLAMQVLRDRGGYAVSVEDPPEMLLEGRYGNAGYCLQLDARKDGYGPVMERIMRQRPDIVILGEIRSPTAAYQAVRASINGHLVISTIHAGSPVEGIQSLVTLAEQVEGSKYVREILATGLIASLSQTLSHSPRRLSMQYLFCDNVATRAKIRQGNIMALNDEMQKQSNLLLNGYGVSKRDD